MFRSLRCENFKCFRDTTELNIAPITIIVGENNSGKSAIIQALNVLAMTFKSGDRSACLRLTDNNYDYGGFEDIVFNHEEKNSITLSYGIKADIRPVFGEKKERTMYVKVRLTFGYLTRRKEIYLERFVLEDPDGVRFKIEFEKYYGSKKIFIRGFDLESKYISRLIKCEGLSITLKEGFFETIEYLEKKCGKERGRALFNEIDLVYDVLFDLRAEALNIFHLGPLRVPPGRTYLYPGGFSEWVGKNGEFALQNYAVLMKRTDKESLEKIELINNDLFRLGFVSGFESEKMGPRHFEFWTKHTKSYLKANLADTGFGASQVLPIIISLYTAKSGSTLLYEEPEIHLHPAAQANLGTVFANCVSSDRALIVETHSENLILRIQTAIANNELKPEDVLILYIMPRKDGHKVHKIPLGSRGEFLASWPKGFFEENYIESLKLFKARKGGRNGSTGDR